MDIDYRPVIDWSQSRLIFRYDSECLADAISAFGANTERIKGFAMMPAVVAAHALKTQAQNGVDSINDLYSGTATVELYAKSIPAVGIGVNSMLFSILTNIWTAFETLAGDVWTRSGGNKGDANLYIDSSLIQFWNIKVRVTFNSIL